MEGDGIAEVFIVGTKGTTGERRPVAAVGFTSIGARRERQNASSVCIAAARNFVGAGEVVSFGCSKGWSGPRDSNPFRRLGKPGHNPYTRAARAIDFKILPQEYGARYAGAKPGTYWALAGEDARRSINGVRLHSSTSFVATSPSMTNLR